MDRLKATFVKQFAARGGASFLGKALPFGVGAAIGNVLWVVLAGWWLALGHIASAIALAITIIGIPFAWANLKMVPVALLPLGKEIVDQR